MILAVVNAIYAIAKEVWKKKIQDFNGIWTRDLAIPVRRSYQLSYEATDVGSWPVTSSYVPVEEYMSGSHIWFISYTFVRFHLFHGNI